MFLGYLVIGADIDDNSVARRVAIVTPGGLSEVTIEREYGVAGEVFKVFSEMYESGHTVCMGLAKLRRELKRISIWDFLMEEGIDVEVASNGTDGYSFVYGGITFVSDAEGENWRNDLGSVNLKDISRLRVLDGELDWVSVGSGGVSVASVDIGGVEYIAVRREDNVRFEYNGSIMNLDIQSFERFVEDKRIEVGFREIGIEMAEVNTSDTMEWPSRLLIVPLYGSATITFMQLSDGRWTYYTTNMSRNGLSLLSMCRGIDYDKVVASPMTMVELVKALGMWKD